MRKADVHIGDRLTVKKAMYADSIAKCYHDGVVGCDHCNPLAFNRYHKQMIEPGMVGTVVHVDTPSPTRNRSFLNIDFELNGHMWRLRPWYDEVKIPRN